MFRPLAMNWTAPKVFTLIAQPMTRVFTDGHPANEAIIPTMKQLYGEMMTMMASTQQTALAGTTRDVEFVAWNPGMWRLHCHKLHM